MRSEALALSSHNKNTAISTASEDTRALSVTRLADAYRWVRRALTFLCHYEIKLYQCCRVPSTGALMLGQYAQGSVEAYCRSLPGNNRRVPPLNPLWLDKCSVAH